MRHMKRFILFIILSTHLFAITGYVRLSGPSICMDNCSIYFLENENGEFLSWITYLDSIEILDFYNDRFVDVEGDTVQCVECHAEGPIASIQPTQIDGAKTHGFPNGFPNPWLSNKNLGLK